MEKKDSICGLAGSPVVLRNGLEVFRGNSIGAGGWRLGVWGGLLGWMGDFVNAVKAKQGATTNTLDQHIT